MKFRINSKSGQLECDWLTIRYVIVDMASVAGSSFSVSVRGHVSHCNIPQLQGMEVACKYSYEIGADWQVAAGLEDGFSQLTASSSTEFVLNLPLDCTFKSTNPSGWPRLVVELVGPNNWGQDHPRGFGWVMVPPIPGSRKVTVPLYLPRASSQLQALSHWFSGSSVNFTDPKHIARPIGRELTRVETVGSLQIQFDITTTNLSKFGYDVGKG